MAIRVEYRNSYVKGWEPMVTPPKFKTLNEAEVWLEKALDIATIRTLSA